MVTACAFCPGGNVDDGKSSLIGVCCRFQDDLKKIILEASSRFEKSGTTAKKWNLALLVESACRRARAGQKPIDVASRYFFYAKAPSLNHTPDTPHEHTPANDRRLHPVIWRIILIDAVMACRLRPSRHQLYRLLAGQSAYRPWPSNKMDLKTSTRFKCSTRSLATTYRQCPSGS